jgi:hypothetical protein
MEEPITIVSGLPRSGTSMMMRMLEAGGTEVLSDGLRKADEDNPHGYFELEKAKKIKDDPSWLPDARGKVLKMVSMLLESLPPGHGYRVIFMKRAIGEMLASQEKMLRRLGKEETGPDRVRMRGIYEKHLGHIQKWLGGRPDIEVLYVNFRDVIREPAGQAAVVNAFMGGGLDEGKMAAAVDGSLYRNRAAGAEG